MSDKVHTAWAVALSTVAICAMTVGGYGCKMETAVKEARDNRARYAAEAATRMEAQRIEEAERRKHEIEMAMIERGYTAHDVNGTRLWVPPRNPGSYDDFVELLQQLEYRLDHNKEWGDQMARDVEATRERDEMIREAVEELDGERPEE